MDSEYRTYEYIRQVLGDLGWDTRNPEKGGDVYAQKEFYRHDDLLKKALGHKAPENIVRIPWKAGFRYWIIEAKRNHRELKNATKEAKDYAKIINDVDKNRQLARYATGIAGTPDTSFYVSTYYWDSHKWTTGTVINGMKSPLTTMRPLAFSALNSAKTFYLEIIPRLLIMTLTLTLS